MTIIKNILLIIIFSLLTTSSLYTQYERHILQTIITTKCSLDSCVFYEKPYVLDVIPESELNPELLITPEGACQACASFTSMDWARKLISPSVKEIELYQPTYDNRHTADYLENASVEIFFTCYFKYQNKRMALCFSEDYIKDTLTITQFSFFELTGDKWLYYYGDNYLNDFDNLCMLKQKYIIALFKNEKIENEPIFNDFLGKAVIKGKLDIYHALTVLFGETANNLFPRPVEKYKILLKIK